MQIHVFPYFTTKLFSRALFIQLLILIPLSHSEELEFLDLFNTNLYYTKIEGSFYYKLLPYRPADPTAELVDITGAIQPNGFYLSAKTDNGLSIRAESIQNYWQFGENNNAISLSHKIYDRTDDNTLIDLPARNAIRAKNTLRGLVGLGLLNIKAGSFRPVGPTNFTAIESSEGFPIKGTFERFDLKGRPTVVKYAYDNKGDIWHGTATVIYHTIEALIPFTTTVVHHWNQDSEQISFSKATISLIEIGIAPEHVSGYIPTDLLDSKFDGVSLMISTNGIRHTVTPFGELIPVQGDVKNQNAHALLSPVHISAFAALVVFTTLGIRWIIKR